MHIFHLVKIQETVNVRSKMAHLSVKADRFVNELRLMKISLKGNDLNYSSPQQVHLQRLTSNLPSRDRLRVRPGTIATRRAVLLGYKEFARFLGFDFRRPGPIYICAYIERLVERSLSHGTIRNHISAIATHILFGIISIFQCTNLGNRSCSGQPERVLAASC